MTRWLGATTDCARCADMFRLARACTYALVGTMTWLTTGWFEPMPIARAQEPASPAPPAAPGAKPSNARVSNAMKQLRARREQVKANKGKSAAKKGSSKAERRAKRKRDAKRRNAAATEERPTRGKKVDLSLEAKAANDAKPTKKPNETAAAPRVRRPLPPLPPVRFTETELALKQALHLQIVEAGPDERWQVVLSNRSRSPIQIATDPRLLAFEARVPGKAETVTCRLPEGLQPRSRELRNRPLFPGDQYTFSVDPLMYCFETGDQTILVPGTFVTPVYGFPEKTKTQWSFGRKYQERLEQVAPYAAAFVDPKRIRPFGPPPRDDASETDTSDEVAENVSPVSDAADEGSEPTSVTTEPEVSKEGLKSLTGEGFALRSEYQGWAKTRPHRHSIGDTPKTGLRLSIASGSDAPTARDVTVTVKLENQSDIPQRVYFRRDLVSFLIRGPDGEHRCSAESAELRAPDKQAFITLAPGKSSSFTTRLIEFCPAESFARAGFYYVSAVLPATSPADYRDEEIFTGKLATSRPRAVRLHRGELPFLIRRGGVSGGGTASSGRFTRSPNANMAAPSDQIVVTPPPPPEPPPPPPPEPPSQ